MTPDIISKGRVVCFAAHPDDETIGAGGQLPFLHDVWVVQATDGAPRNLYDAERYGFCSREAYAEARQAERLEALRIAGIAEERALLLGFVDQETAHALPELTERVAEVLQELRPAVALVPPYEGGHPDHDSLSFAVHMASKEMTDPPKLVEYASYHSDRGYILTGEFLPPHEEVVTVELAGRPAELKRQMLDCYDTQRETLQLFRCEYERFRPAPAYDFSEPPHPGILFYENFNWGITGEQWRALAGRCLC